MFLLGRVPPALRGVVRRLAAYDERSDLPVRRRQAPAATCTLVVGIADPLRVDGRRVGSFAAGLTDTAAVTEFAGHQAGVQADLTPLGAWRLLGTPLPGLVSLPELGGAFAGLDERLADRPTWPGRLALVADVLTDLLAAAPAPLDPEVARAWSLLDASAGRVAVGALAAEVGWSRRHLSRRFTAQVGLPPTVAGRVLRFRRAADLLVPPPGARLHRQRIADVAAGCGFADHAHLDREFAALAGCSPREYVAQWAAVAVDPADVTVAPGPGSPTSKTDRPRSATITA
ncbi:helix-turn-helix domain-containing protein [Actinomycetospora atypica]|uniref:Helix-turn-helix domain-containing protein n=1 Tax=Actinomycetospora atypica TaxID=1290095 RepID=A0ABV9YUG0_9PSEU